MSGPAPKPTALKKLAGNPGKRPLNEHEPQPVLCMPDCPRWLRGAGRKEFLRVAEILSRTRVLTEADVTGLAAYAYEVGQWYSQIQRLAGEDEILISDKGGRYLNPRIGLVNMHLKNMLKLMGEFGLTPASRTRIMAQPPERELTLAEELFEAVTHDAD